MYAVSPFTTLPAPADYSEVLEILKKTDFDPHIAMKRQLTLHVRNLILKKSLLPKTRLPPLNKLADLWGTNYFTTQTALSPLVREGLLIQTPKKGTFVASSRQPIRRVCIYHEYDLSSDWHNEFYSQLNIWCYRLLSQRGIVTIPYFDHRPKSRKKLIPPEIKEMSEGRQIDALLTTCIHRENTAWLSKLDVPFATHVLNEGPHQLQKPNTNSFVRLVIAEVEKFACRGIGFITILPDDDPMRSELRQYAASRGIAFSCPKLPPDPLHWEKTGFQLCGEILKSKPRPELIFVYPDTLIRGVCTALLKTQIKIPEQMKIVSHRNAESQIFLPFPVTWLTVKIEDLARALIKRIEQQTTGKKLELIELDVAVQKSSPH